MTRRARVSALALLALGAALAFAGALWASFGAPSVPGASGRAVATVLPTGSTPSGVANGGFVDVQWLQSTVEGHAVGGYVVKRYDAGSGALQVTGVGCQGTIAALECTETTPPGSWRYTVTPVLDSWTGGESGESGAVVVSSASLTLAPTVVGGVDHPLPVTLTGSVGSFAGGENVLFRLDSSTGTPLGGTVAGTATPPAAPVAGGGSAAVTVTIPNDPAVLDGGHSVYAVGDNSSVAAAGVVVDRLPPTVSLTDPGSSVRGTIGLSASAGDATSGVASVTFQRSPSGAGSWTTIATATGAPYTASFDTTGVADGPYDFRAVATDAAGNAASSTVAGRLVDNTVPAQALSLSVPSGAHLSGSTLYFKSDAAGSFKLADAVTDAGSAPASASFPGIGATGWTHAAETVSGASPYTSSLYSWSGGASTPPDQSISAADAAGNSSTSTLHFVSDTTAPGGGSVDASGLVGTGSRYSTSTTLSIALAKGADAGSGIASSGAQLLREQGALSSSDGQADGTCDFTGQSFALVATDPATPYADNAAGGIVAGKCYRYEYVVGDRVGNQATYTSPSVKVVTAAPNANVNLSGASGNTFISGSTVFINPQAGKSGGFTAASTASDALAGLTKVTFPSLAGFGAGGGDVASPGPYQTNYSWSGAGATASGAQSVTATSNSTLTQTAAFTVTPDTTPPTTTASGADASWHSTAVTVSLSAVDGGAGVGSVTYRVDSQAPVTTGGSSASVSVTAPSNGSNDGTHTVTYYATDAVGNAESSHSVQVKIDTQAPTASSTFPAAAGSYNNAGWSAGCTSAICGSASDPGSGVTQVQVTVQQVSTGKYWSNGSAFDQSSEAAALHTATGTTSWSLAFPQTNFPADGTYVVRVYTTDALGNTTAVGSPSRQITFVFDRTAPSPTVTFPAAAAFYNDAGWNLSTCGGGTGNVCGTATDATSGVASTQVSIQQGSTSKYWDPNTTSFSSVSEVKVTALGTTSWSLGLFPAANFPAEGSYTVRSYATDAAGNASATPAGTTFAIDRTAPTQALTLSVPSGAYLASGNVYFKSDAGGSFRLVDTETDSGSGPASATFPAIATTGWTHGAETVGGSSPYTSGLYSWSAGASTPADQPISAADAAGNSGSSSLHFVPDTTAPGGGSVDATGLTGVGPRYSTSTTLSIALAKGSDGAGSGVAATGALLKREQGTLSSSDGQANGTCDYTGQSYSTIASDPAGPYTDNAAGGILTGKCYRYQYVVPDNVGNQVTYTSGDVKVETAAPASLTPVITPSGASGNTTISGGTVFINPQAGKSGGFTVSATASDATGGVQKLNFPALTGFSVGGGDVAAPGPYGTTYSWSGAGATASGSQTVTATGSSSLTRTGTFTVTPDTTAPTTTASGADASWHNTPVTVSLSASDGAGAGVSSVTYQVDSGSPVTVGGSSTSVIVSAPANGSNDGTHTVTYYSTDGVGNVESSHSVQVKIDTQAPIASSTFPAAAGSYNNAGWNAGCTSAICGSASDVGSGVSTVKLTIQQVSSGLYWNSGSTFDVASEASALKTATGTTSWSLAFPQTNFPADGTYVVRVYTTDALGNTTAVGSPSRQITFVFDRTAPAATVTFPVSSGKYNTSGWNGGCAGAICGTATDATSGVASAQVSIQQASTSKYWDPNTSSFSSASEVKVTASGTTSWSLAFAPANFPDGNYTVRGYAVDAAGNTNATPPGTTFLVDRTAPTQAISTASSNTVVTGAADAWTVYYNGNTSNGSFALSDTATDTGGSGLTGNDVWAAFNPGGGWTSKIQASCLASGACASGTYAWTGTNPTSGVTTTVATQDAAGNQDAAALTFVSDTQAPSAPTMTALPAQIRNGQSLSVGSAVDNGGSGVKSVAYYYCSGGACAPSTLIGSSATGPSYSFAWSALPADGTYTVAAKVTDNVGNVSALGATQTITVDNTAPTVTAVALANGGVAKTADAGDTATITYSEKIKASTFCSSWVDDGSTQTLSGVTLNFTNNGSSDALTIASAGCTFHLQQVVAGPFIAATMTIPGSTLAWNPTAMTLTITLGTPSGSVSTNVSPSKPSYTPDGALTDWAGNAISTSTFTSGSNSNF